MPARPLLTSPSSYQLDVVRLGARVPAEGGRSVQMSPSSALLTLYGRAGVGLSSSPKDPAVPLLRWDPRAKSFGFIRGDGSERGTFHGHCVPRYRDAPPHAGGLRSLSPLQDSAGLQGCLFLCLRCYLAREYCPWKCLSGCLHAQLFCIYPPLYSLFPSVLPCIARALAPGTRTEYIRSYFYVCRS